MKYEKPIKFKRAIKELINYISINNGINSEDSWRQEIYFIKSMEIDPKDYIKFDKAKSKLEAAGKLIAEVYGKL